MVLSAQRCQGDEHIIFVLIEVLIIALGLSRFAAAQTCSLPDAAITFDGSASDGYVCGGQQFTATLDLSVSGGVSGQTLTSIGIVAGTPSP